MRCERATIDKDFVSAVQNPGTGIWTVTYTLTVTNPNAADPVTYDLSDDIGYPAGVTVTGVAVTGPAGAPINPSFDGNADQTITTDRTLAGGTSDVYTLVVTADVPITVPDDVRACQEGPGFGFYNNGTVTTSGLTDSDDACGNIPPPPIPTVAKTVTSTTQQADGSWTIVYDLAVTNGNPTYVTVYNLTDALHFGGGITINSAGVAGVGGLSTNAAWDGVGDTNVLPSALPRLLGPATTDHYTVTANATVGPTARSPIGTAPREDQGDRHRLPEHRDGQHPQPVVRQFSVLVAGVPGPDQDPGLGGRGSRRHQLRRHVHGHREEPERGHRPGVHAR